MSPLKRILAFAKPHQKYLFLSIFFNLLYSVFQIFSVLVMLPVLQMIFNVDQEKITKPVYSGKFSEYFSNRYMQFPDVSTKKLLDYIDSYKSGNYTIFYRNKARRPAYNYINQYINLKYKGTRGETRSGYFIP